MRSRQGTSPFFRTRRTENCPCCWWMMVSKSKNTTMPSPTVRLVNRAAFSVYQGSLTLEQIMVFEYFIDIARFSPQSIFRIKYGTIQRELRLGRRKTEAILKWMMEMGLISERPSTKNEAKTYYFDFHHLSQNPELIFADQIPVTPEYEFLLNRSEQNKRLELFKSYGRRRKGKRLEG